MLQPTSVLPNMLPSTPQWPSGFGEKEKSSSGKRKRNDGDEDMDDAAVLRRIHTHGLKPGPGNSLIWEFFQKYNVGNESQLRYLGVCKICCKMEEYSRAETKMGKDLSTGNLKSHLQHNHRAEFSEFYVKQQAKVAAKLSAKEGAVDIGGSRAGGEGGGLGEEGVVKKKKDRGGGKMFFIKTENILEVRVYDLGSCEFRV